MEELVRTSSERQTRPQDGSHDDQLPASHAPDTTRSTTPPHSPDRRTETTDIRRQSPSAARYDHHPRHSSPEREDTGSRLEAAFRRERERSRSPICRDRSPVSRAGSDRECSTEERREPVAFRSPRHHDDHSRSPPNVTVLHPTVTHPMFPYMYPGAGAMFPGGVPPHLPHMPPQMPPHPSFMQPGDQPGSGAPHPMLLGSHLALSSHWQAAAVAALSRSAAAADALHLPGSGHYGMPHSRSEALERASQRFSPYALPLTRTTMVTTGSPVTSTGHTHPHSPPSSSPSSPHSLPSPTARRHHSTDSPPAGDARHSQDSPRHHVTSSGTAPSDLKNIERMVSGLVKQQERIATNSLTRLTDHWMDTTRLSAWPLNRHN